MEVAPRSGVISSLTGSADGWRWSRNMSSGDVIAVVTSAMSTIMVKSGGLITPMSSPTFRMTSSMSPRVFMQGANRERFAPGHACEPRGDGRSTEFTDDRDQEDDREHRKDPGSAMCVIDVRSPVIAKNTGQEDCAHDVFDAVSNLAGHRDAPMF